MKKVSILSGGGSWGAFTVGKLYGLKEDYDLVIGSSTGALMAPFVALGEWEKLKVLYTTITYENIFNVNPFKKNGKINYLKAIWRVIRGKKTIGENKNLYELIKKEFTIEFYNKIIASEKDVIITVCDINNKETKYVSIKDNTYEDFCKYMWASASFPLVCDVVKINGNEFIDGGTLENSPLDYALIKKPKHIDIFLHNYKIKNNDVNNIMTLGIRVIEMMRSEIVRNDLKALNSGRIKNVEVKIYDLENEPEKSYLTFNPTLMSKWFREGLESIK